MRFIGLLAVLLGWSLLAQAESLDTVQVPVDGRGDDEAERAEDGGGPEGDLLLER